MALFVYEKEPFFLKGIKNSFKPSKIDERFVCYEIDGYGDTEGTGGSFDFYELGEPVFDADGNLNENIGTEKRNFLEVGIRYMEAEERTCRWFLEMALQLNSVKVENADLYIEGKAFTMIDYYGGANYDPTITQTVIDPMLGGVGFGMVAGGGLRLKINAWSALEPFGQLQYSRFRLEEPYRFTPNFQAGIRIIVRDYLFV